MNNEYYVFTTVISFLRTFKVEFLPNEESLKKKATIHKENKLM